MDQSTPSPPDILADAVAWIERQLDEPLTLETIAEYAGLSPYHFSRLFTARMGRSVMAYVRGRRLIRGARRLVDSPDTKLVDLAFDCGFESQEAFTRAFKRLFGASPGRFRSGFAVAPMEGQFPMHAPSDISSSVAQLPELVFLDEFTVAGPARGFDQTTKAEIPQLWPALIGALPFDGQLPSWKTYGVVWGVDRSEGSFRYMAGVGVETGAKLPEGFEAKTIPASRYAVFRIALNGSALHPQIQAAMATIWGKLLPTSGLKLADGPDFEIYDDEFAPDRAGATIDFYIPVEA